MQPTKLHRLGATLSLANRGTLDPEYILYGLLSGVLNAYQVRLSSGRLFVLAAQKLLNNLAQLDIRAVQWANHRWNMEYIASAFRLRASISRTNNRLAEKRQPKQFGLSSMLRTGVRQLYWSVHKWGLAPSPNCESGEQTAEHVLTAYLIHWSIWSTRTDGLG